MAVRTADQAWIKKDKKAQGAHDKTTHKGALIHDGPFVSIRQLHYEEPWNLSPKGQGRFFLISFKNPIRKNIVEKRIMAVFGEKESLKNETS